MMIRRNVGRRTDKECHLLDMQAIRMTDGVTDTVTRQAGRGLVTMKTLPGTRIMTLRTEAGDQPKTIQLPHPLHHIVITTAPKEGKEDDMAEEVVTEAEVRLQGTAATADIRDDLYPRTMQGTRSTLT